MKVDVITFSLVMALALLSLSSRADNIIEIDQAGDNFALTIVQVGANNKIQCYTDASCWQSGDDMSLHFHQENDTTSVNKIELWHLDGENNSIRWGQGAALNNAADTTFSNDGSEGGGHYARHDIHGDNNSIAGFQTNQGSTSGHYFASLIFSDDNVVWVKQLGNGSKTINLLTYSDGNEISIVQKGSGAEHNASVSLYGSYPTDISLIQEGSLTQNYSVSQTCLTIGGCTISVTQD
jgi:hypothetical protein